MPEPNHILIDDPALVSRPMIFALPCKSGNTTLKIKLYEVIHGEGSAEKLRANVKDQQFNIHAQDLFTYVSLARSDLWRMDVVGLIRHPRERVQSQFSYTSGPLQSFSYWMRMQAHQSDAEVDQHERSQLWDLSAHGIFLPQTLIYLEAFDDDWDALCTMMHWPIYPTPTYRNSLEENDITRRPCPEMNDPESETHKYFCARFGGDLFVYRHMMHLRARARLNRAHGMESLGLSSAQGPSSVHGGGASD